MASKPINPIIQKLMDLIQSPDHGHIARPTSQFCYAVSCIKRGSDVSYASNPSRASRVGQMSAGLRILALVLLALAQTVVKAAPAQAASEANVTQPSVACPSQDFNEFLAAFSERADLQRRYTLPPLQYGEYETVAGTPTKWRKIRKIEDIPEFNAETGLVLRNNVQRSEKHLDLNIERRSDDRLNDVIIFQEEHGYNGYAMRYYFNFQKDGCWYLYAIKDGP
jgi:hypothetical protein